MMNFYLQPGGMFFLPDVKKPVVTELSCRAKDADAMSAAAEQLRGLGFAECFRVLASDGVALHVEVDHARQPAAPAGSVESLA